jgi:hypothetical protein
MYYKKKKKKNKIWNLTIYTLPNEIGHFESLCGGIIVEWKKFWQEIQVCFALLAVFSLVKVGEKIFFQVHFSASLA